MSKNEFEVTLGFDSLKRDVINSGLCSACGTCVGVCASRCLAWDDRIEEPTLTGECKACGTCYATCPGKDIPMPKLEEMFFSRVRLPADGLLGIRTGQLSGYSLNPAIRERGAGGGVTTALLTYALETGQIDAAVVANMNRERPWVVEPRIASTASEMLDAAKSKYCVVPSNVMLREALKGGMRLGMVGVPCQIEGIRKVQMIRRPRRVADSVKLTIGIFCGGNIPRMLTEHVILKVVGVSLNQVARFEYRGGPQSQDVRVTTRDGEVHSVPLPQISPAIRNVFRDRCSMCLDLTAELADISVGDIYVAAAGGLRVPNVSAILVRTKRGKELMESACKAGYIHVSNLADSGFYHNVGVEMKGYFNPYRIEERERHALPTPDYHRKVIYHPPRPCAEAAVLQQQYDEIPELDGWVRADQRLSQLVTRPNKH